MHEICAAICVLPVSQVAFPDAIGEEYFSVIMVDIILCNEPKSCINLIAAVQKEN